MTTLKRPYEFPESQRETTGGGPDFPGSSGDRERGKFRPSATPRLAVIAVAGDDGRPVPITTNELLAQTLLWQKAMVVALMWNTEGEEFTISELLSEASRL